MSDSAQRATEEHFAICNTISIDTIWGKDSEGHVEMKSIICGSCKKKIWVSPSPLKGELNWNEAIELALGVDDEPKDD